VIRKTCKRGAILVAGVMAASAMQAGSLADPTQPYGAKRARGAPVIAAVTVSAVVSSTTRRVAIVNGVVVQAGGRVGDATIVEVLADGVRYQRQGKEYVSRIAPLAAKVRASTSRIKAGPTVAASQEVSP
jgi:sRNA-binding protein